MVWAYAARLRRALVTVAGGDRGWAVNLGKTARTNASGKCMACVWQGGGIEGGLTLMGEGVVKMGENWNWGWVGLRTLLAGSR
jgi:hypothetical protein